MELVKKSNFGERVYFGEIKLKNLFRGELLPGTAEWVRQIAQKPRNIPPIFLHIAQSLEMLIVCKHC